MGYKSFEYKENGEYLGFFEGYVDISINSDDFEFYLENHNVSNASIDSLRQVLKRDVVSILMNLGVASEKKQQGLGNKILDMFLSETSSPCILICSLADKNNFSLQTWYERKGFQVVDWAKGNPVMIKIK